MLGEATDDPARHLEDGEIAQIKALMVDSNQQFMTPFVHKETRGLYEDFFRNISPGIDL